MENILYVIADVDYDSWIGGSGLVDLRKTAVIKKNGVYKGTVIGKFIKGKNYQWNPNHRPFRQISKVEAFVLSRGKVAWLP
jgi:hypothetical protein